MRSQIEHRSAAEGLRIQPLEIDAKDREDSRYRMMVVVQGMGVINGLEAMSSGVGPARKKE